MSEPQAEYDSPWKEALEHYLPQFFAFFFPEVYDGIDWSRPPEFLGKELQQIMPESAVGPRVVDKLVKVWLRKGGEAWILIHIEVQSQEEAGFPERMYIYSYRGYDCRRRRVVSLAVLGDTQPDWRPHEFGYELWGCEVRLKFPIVKLLDYEAQWEMLETSANVFAPLTMAHLRTQSTHGDPESRRAWKVRVVKSLYERGWSREDVRQLFRFVDWMMTLPDELTRSFWLEMERFEEERKMTYVTSVERMAKEDGAREMAQGILLDLLRDRFGPVPDGLIERVQSIADPERLRRLSRLVANAAGLDDVSRAMSS